MWGTYKMKVYTLTSVYWEHYDFDHLEAVGSDLQALIAGRRLQHLPVFSNEDVEHEDFDTPREDDRGFSHYYYQEWDV